MNDERKTKKQLIEELKCLRLEQIEKSRVTSEQFTKMLLQNSISMTITAVKDGRFIEVSDAFLRIIGRQREEIIGHTTTNIGFITEEQRTFFFNELSKKGRVENFELELRPTNGVLKYGLFNSQRIIFNNEDCLLTTIQDITERKFRENEQAMMVRLMELINRQGDLRQLMSELTASLQQWSGCEAVGIRLRDGDDYPYYETRGFASEFVELESKLCTYGPDGAILRDGVGNPLLECMCGNILCGRFDPQKPFFTAHGSFWSNNTTALLASTTEADRQARTRNRCNGEGYESVALVPLRDSHQVFGLLQFNDHRPNRFTPELMANFERMADGLAIALSRHQAEEALLKSENLYHSLFDNMLNGFAYCKMIYEHGQPADFVYLAVNRNFESLTGLKNVIGKKVSDVIPGFKESEQELIKIYGRVAKNGLPEKHEIYLESLKMWFSVSVYSQQTGYFVAIFDVITERKRTEEELRKSRNELRDVQRLAHIGVWNWVVETDTVFWTEELYHIAGLDSTLPAPAYAEQSRIYAPESWNRLKEAAERSIDTGDTFELELQLIRPDGTIRWVYAFGGATYDHHGKITGLHGTLQDITPLKQAEEVLRIKERRYRMAEAMGHVGNWEYNLQTTKFWGSDEAKRIYGLDPEASDFSTDEIENCIPERERVHQALIDLIESNKPYNLEFEIYPKKVLKPRIISSIAELTLDEHGTPLLVTGVIQDITDRKQSEEEKQALEERLQRAEKMEALGLLAGGVAHDLNNVLGIVVGYAEMMLSDIDERTPRREDLLNIMEGGEKAAAIVQDLLTLARRGVTGRKTLNLNKLVLDFQKSPEWEKLLSYHPKVRIKTDLEADLLNISASSVHLEKTLFNLISNADEAMPNGGILTIQTANRYLDKPVPGYDHIREGDYVVLSVADKGEGIQASDLKRIFEPFYTKKIMGRSGTGLGLSVVWGTVKDHMGYIDVQSEQGKGTTFSLYFPVTREEISTEASVSASEYMGKGESILVVDDVKGQRDLASAMLTKLNYKVLSVASGEEAVEYLRNNKVDLLVLDMIMDPGMDGLDTYKSILEINPKQRAIIVSGFSESDRVHEVQKLGAGEYVKKPYIQEKLGLAVKNELHRSA